MNFKIQVSGGDNGQQGKVQDAANVRIVPAFGRFPVRFSKITSLSQVVCHVFLLLFTANFTLHCGCCGEWSSEQGVLSSEPPVPGMCGIAIYWSVRTRDQERVGLDFYPS